MSRGRTIRKPRFVRGDSRLTLEQRLAIGFPRLAARGNRLILRLPATSRIRRALLWRAVRLGYAAQNATNQVNVANLTPDAVLIQPGAEVGAEGEFHGPEGFVRGWQVMTDTWDDYHAVPEELIDPGGNQIVVFARLRGRAHASGIPLDEPVAHVFTFRDGQIAKLHVFENRDKALEAVGLSE
jgi:ketosteroid isomerase-like protein